MLDLCAHQDLIMDTILVITLRLLNCEKFIIHIWLFYAFLLDVCKWYKRFLLRYHVYQTGRYS